MVVAKKFSHWLSASVILLIFFFLGRSLLLNWQAVKNYSFLWQPSYLIFASFIYLLGWSGAAVIWREILIKSGNYLSAAKVYQAFFLGQLAKYLPGKIWSFWWRWRLLKNDISLKTYSLTSLLEVSLASLAGIILGISFTLSLFKNIQGSTFLIILFIIGGLLVLKPRFLYFLLNWFLKKANKETVKQQQLNYLQLLWILTGYLLIFICWGVAFYFFTQALTGQLNLSLLPGFIGAYALAFVLGFLAPLAPMGLGVREGVISLFLLGFVEPGVNVALAILVRLIISVLELLSTACIFLWLKIRRL